MQLRRIMGKFGTILPKRQKAKFVILALMMIVGGFLEMCSVSLILPFVEAIMNPEQMMSNSIVSAVCRLLRINSNRSFLIMMSLLLAAIYVLKNAFLLFQLKVQNHFVRRNRFTVQQKLLQSYISRPYEYFLGVDSAEIIRIITEDTSLAFALLGSVLLFMSEFVVTLVLIVAIFVISPEITTAMAIMMVVLVLIIMRILRPILRKATLERQKAGASMTKWLLQSIHGIKELKVMRKEDFFLNEYKKYGKVYIEAMARNATLTQVPRYLIEAIAMGSFLVVIAGMIARGVDLEALVPILSVVAMAAIRLLPAVNKISQCLADMTANEPYLDKLLEVLGEVNEYEGRESVEKAPGTVRLLSDKVELSDIHYQYPSGDFEVLNGASCTIKKGDSVGIIGASGAGKTTAIDILLGLLHPLSGQVLSDGVDIRQDPAGWLSQIGYIPQSIFILDGSIRDNVAFGIPKDEVDDEKIWNALKEAALYDFVKSIPEGLDTQLGDRGVRLSGGQRQRIGIARAMYADPQILFFDEATSALDNETEAEIMESIDHLHGSKTMVIIAHRLSTIEGCDHVLKVDSGRIEQVR